MFRLWCVHVQTFVRSPDFRAFMFRLSGVHVRFSCVHVQTFVRSCPDFRAFDRLSCVHVHTFVRLLMFPDYVILNARRPPRALIFGLDIFASVWDLSLGIVQEKKYLIQVDSIGQHFKESYPNTTELGHKMSIIALQVCAELCKK